MTDLAAIIQDRTRTHGDFGRHACIAQSLKSFVRVQLVNPEKFSFRQAEALDMILHKIARIIAGNPNHVDHWIDIAGYALLAAEQSTSSIPVADE